MKRCKYCYEQSELDVKDRTNINDCSRLLGKRQGHTEIQSLEVWKSSAGSEQLSFISGDENDTQNSVLKSPEWARTYGPAGGSGKVQDVAMVQAACI